MPFPLLLGQRPGHRSVSSQGSEEEQRRREGAEIAASQPPWASPPWWPRELPAPAVPGPESQLEAVAIGVLVFRFSKMCYLTPRKADACKALDVSSPSTRLAPRPRPRGGHLVGALEWATGPGTRAVQAHEDSRAHLAFPICVLALSFPFPLPRGSGHGNQECADRPRGSAPQAPGTLKSGRQSGT